MPDASRATIDTVIRPEKSPLIVDAHRASLTVGDRSRSFITVRGRTPEPRLQALLIVLHGTVQTVASTRPFAGFSLDRLAVGGATTVIYPDAVRREWNGARTAMMTAHPLAPYEGGAIAGRGRFSKGEHLSAPETARYFARSNGITADPTVTELPHRRDVGKAMSVTRRDYTAPGAAPVRFYTVHGGGHVLNNPDHVSAQWFWGPSTGDLRIADAVGDFFDMPCSSPTPQGAS